VFGKERWREGFAQRVGIWRLEASERGVGPFGVGIHLGCDADSMGFERHDFFGFIIVDRRRGREVNTSLSPLPTVA
jgi:hypothetical protein